MDTSSWNDNAGVLLGKYQPPPMLHKARAVKSESPFWHHQRLFAALINKQFEQHRLPVLVYWACSFGPLACTSL